jgi:F-type H+-transporting ATPase subunit alpha
MPLKEKLQELFSSTSNGAITNRIKAVDAIPLVVDNVNCYCDRQTGKSTVCIDTILNQKEFYDAGNLCLYICCNWTKASTVAGIAKC